jgi:ABC-type multidrug transport system ATPase subunit
MAIEGVSKSFGSTRALDSLSLEIPRGIVFGLLGANGAGKTTLFSIAASFLRADAGRIAVLGHDVADVEALRGRLTILPQDALFQRNIPILEQLTLFRLLGGASKATAERDVRSALEMVGLAEYAHRRVNALSHGMIQRLGIAQAFLGEPEVILLDEPTSGLDPRNARNIRDLVLTLRGRATVVVSSHNLAEVQELCDHVAILDKGKLVASGSVDALTRGGRELELGLSEALGEAPLSALSRAQGVAGIVEVGHARYKLSLVAEEGVTEFDIVIRDVLTIVLNAGITPRMVREGNTLEAEFLKLTAAP